MLKGRDYEITKANLPVHEWIGLEAKVIESTDKTRIGAKGKIVDETKNVIIIETKKGEKKLPKKEIKLEVVLGKEKVQLDCTKLSQRPEDRIKYFGGN